MTHFKCKHNLPTFSIQINQTCSNKHISSAPHLTADHVFPGLPERANERRVRIPIRNSLLPLLPNRDSVEKNDGRFSSNDNSCYWPNFTFEIFDPYSLHQIYFSPFGFNYANFDHIVYQTFQFNNLSNFLFIFLTTQ